jgi:isopenicillin-N epimerase
LAPRGSAAPELPDRSLLDRDPEAYWKRVREEQFFLPSWRSYLNTGSLGVPPKRVVQRVQEALYEGASLTRNEYPRWGYETLEAERQELAAFLGCRFDEIAFTHNATEAMSMIAGGLDLRTGDEVLITDQEHPSGRGPWFCRAARSGCTVREVKIPLPPAEAGGVGGAGCGCNWAEDAGAELQFHSHDHRPGNAHARDLCRRAG